MKGRSLRGCCPSAVPVRARCQPFSRPQRVHATQCRKVGGNARAPAAAASRHTHTKKRTAAADTRRAAGAARRADATRATREGAREARAATEKAMVGGEGVGKRGGERKRRRICAVAVFVSSTGCRLFREASDLDRADPQASKPLVENEAETTAHRSRVNVLIVEKKRGESSVPRQPPTHPSFFCPAISAIVFTHGRRPPGPFRGAPNTKKRIDSPF